jgi:hypothetical protein
VIKNGCGNIVSKPATSRIKMTSDMSFNDQKEISEIQQQDSFLSKNNG